VLDCSGRAGVVARRFRRVQPGHRTHALVGVWERDTWDLPDDTHTVVETFEDGWAWSVPVSATVRHVGVMVGQGAPYRAAVEKTAALRQRLEGATLRHDWACDASLYYSEAYAGAQFFLVGDAGSFIDPLSSFGVKKALASAWLAAVAAHTSLLDSGRQTVARDFFSNWERGVYTTHLGRSRDFARAAELVERAWPALRNGREENVLRGWLAALPHEVDGASGLLACRLHVDGAVFDGPETRIAVPAV